MTTNGWETIGSVDPESLIDTTLQLHWAAQLLASAGQTFVEPRPDDSHRAMAWSDDVGGFVGAEFAGAYPFRVALRPADLTLVLLDRVGDELAALPLAGQTLDEAYEWLSLGMATYMGGGLPVVERPEYDLPEHEVSSGGRFATDRSSELGALAALYAGANAALRPIVDHHAHAADVLCWPHHFDIATLITIAQDEDGTATKTVGVGLAPMGGGYSTWYWYVSPWPYPEAASLPALEAPGGWHTEGWTGAVLRAKDVVDAVDGARSRTVEEFLDRAIEAATRTLS